jgi:hypothetical protein
MPLEALVKPDRLALHIPDMLARLAIKLRTTVGAQPIIDVGIVLTNQPPTRRRRACRPEEIAWSMHRRSSFRTFVSAMLPTTTL